MSNARLVRGLVVLFTGEAVARLLSFLAIALLARRLGDVHWAPVAVALSASQFGALFVESGMRLYGAREVARDHDAAARIAPAVVATQVAIGITLVIAAILVSSLGFVRPELAALLPGYAVALLALPFFVPWVFQGLSLMEWVVVPQAVRYGAFLVLATVIVNGPERLTWLPWVEAASMTAGAGVAYIAMRRVGVRLTITARRAFDATILREATPIAASQLLWVVRMYVPILLLWKLSPEQSVARFDLSHRVMMVMQAFLTMYLTNLFTSLSREAKQPGPAFSRLLFGSTALAVTGAVLVAAALATFAESVLGILYSNVFSHPEATTTLALLAFLVPVLTVRGHGHYALVALGRQRAEFACSLAGSIVLVALLALWIPERAAIGAAHAMLVSELVGTALIWLTVLLPARVAPDVSPERPL